MRYAITHAPKGTTFVVLGDKDSSGQPEILRLRDDPITPQTPADKRGKVKPKIAFVSRLTADDEVFLEMGGPSDRLAIAAIAFGASVYRYPTFKLSDRDVQSVLNRHGIIAEEEPAHKKETSNDLNLRKARALALFGLAKDGLDEFRKVNAPDVSTLRLKVEYRAYRRSQKAVIRAYQGLLAAYRDQAFIELALAKQNAARTTSKDIFNFVVARLAEDILGGDISETERQDFFTAIGSRFKDGVIPERATEEDIEAIVESIMQSDGFRAIAFDRLKSQRRRIERLLEGGKQKNHDGSTEILKPNPIWEAVFKPILGCGPLIGARFTSEIGDIRRFGDLPGLKAFAGYHHFEDGSRARRVAGKPYNVNPTLHQAVYLLCVQTVRTPKSPWRGRFDCRKAYELVKILRERQAEAVKQGLNEEILPPAFAKRRIESVNDVTLTDLATLFAHIDALRKRAGITKDASDDEETPENGDRTLAGLVRGIKKSAHEKALRWLGQQYLKHIFKEWRKAVDLPPLPVR